MARVVQVFWCRRITEIATISADGRKTLVELRATQGGQSLSRMGEALVPRRRSPFAVLRSARQWQAGKKVKNNPMQGRNVKIAMCR